MTLVPEKESGNQSVKSLDERRVYEVFGGADTTLKDFEGRSIAHAGNSLKISGQTAHVIVRVQFAKVKNASAAGAGVKVQQVGDASVLEFDHTGESTISWK